MQGLVAVGFSFNCPDGVVPASHTQGQGCARRPLRLDSVRRTGVLPSQSCRAGLRLYTGTQRRGRLRQPSVRNVAVRALVQEGWPLWAALSACAAGGQVRLQWNMVEYHEICELRWLSWRQNVSVDVCLVLMYLLTLLHDCDFLVLACRYWSKEPHLVLQYLHLCSRYYWHLRCQLAASYQSPVQRMMSSGHTSCHWVRLCTSLSLTCGSKSLTMSASSNSANQAVASPALNMPLS